jgi:hypothetical protein
MLNWNDIRVFLTVPSKGQLLLLPAWWQYSSPEMG